MAEAGIPEINFEEVFQDILDKLDNNSAMLNLLLRAKLHELRTQEGSRSTVEIQLMEEIELALDQHKQGMRVGFRQYPYEDGDVLVIAPETFIDAEGRVMSFMGTQYVKVDEDVPRP